MSSTRTVWRTNAKTETSYEDKEGIGSIRWWEGENPPKAYRWVMNPTTNVAFAAGDLVCHTLTESTIGGKAITLATTEGYIIKPATADLMYLAGVVCTTIASNTGTNPLCYGWIQCFGYNASVSVSNTTNTTYTAGCYLKGLNGQVYATIDAATQASYKKTIQILEAYATGQTPTYTFKKGMIQCL